MVVSIPEIEETEGRTGFVGDDEFACVELKMHMGDPASAIWWVGTCDRKSTRGWGEANPLSGEGMPSSGRGHRQNTGHVPEE